MAGRSPGLRRNLRRSRQKAESLGSLRFAVTADAEPALLDALIDVHRRRWARSGEPGMVDANRAEPFLREAAAELARENMLRVFALYFRDQVAAVALALRNATSLFWYLTAFDPAHATLDLGRDLLARAFEYAHAERYQSWDFLRGDEAYKSAWGAQQIPKCRLVLRRRAEAYMRSTP